MCPCRNGGYCLKTADKDKPCQCTPGFTGNVCETAIGKFQTGSSMCLCIGVCIANRIITNGMGCSQLACQNGASCQDQGFNAICNCKPGFTGLRCESRRMMMISPTLISCRRIFSHVGLEYFRCQGNGRFSDVNNCKNGRYFECVYFGQCQFDHLGCQTTFTSRSFSYALDDLNLPNGILFSRNCPTGLWFSALNDRCDYPSVVQC